ncbi:putative homeobox domain-containing protein [Rosellinia necatrix]|uniref:Putative homeobox domain-containing protein n=1 Tax=Rosellinia necatrix TaxID=77044 RepID=A0A1S7UK94_ROSNE|nr:putative homeobox domain-containing protein [Rosellinia necatrix]
MSFPTASTPSPVHERQDLSFSSSQNSNTDTSTLCFESSFRLETSFPSQKAESEKHPKGKRKRTTSQDKTVLEAAYNANPKPDKAARLDIVKRVSLNEKEVQIWFQNRRQNDRRKSRPLSPQEIEALRYGNGMRVLSSDSMPTSVEPAPMSIAMQNAAELAQGSSADTTTSADYGERPPSPGGAVSQLRSQSSSPQVIEVSRLDRNAKTDSEVRNTSASTPPSPTRGVGGAESESQPYASVSASQVGYLANRWFAGDSFSAPLPERSSEDSFKYGWEARPIMASGIDIRNSRLSSFSSSTSSAADHPPPTIHPHSSSSSSHVRLSLSLDGKAELISAQPSPPRHAAQLPSTETLPPVFSNRILQRSRSAASGVTLPPISTLTKSLTAPFPPQFTRGRSRDVHAWESCCEADTRDELTRHAENESSGSAIAAISLMRSSSSSASLSNLIHNHHSHSPSYSGVLQPNSSKRNAINTTRGSLDKKPRLGRAKTSPPMTRYICMEESGNLADLEGDEDYLEPEKKRRKKQGHQFDILSPSGDSDKENWSPGTGGSPDRRRALPPPETSASPTKTIAPIPRNPRRIGRILGEQDAAAKQLFLNGSTDVRNRHANRANTAPTPGQRFRKPGEAAVAIFEDGGDAGPDGKRDGGRREGEEVERFMRGELSPSKRPDMDCVAGLLSLSQGNWR